MILICVAILFALISIVEQDAVRFWKLAQIPFFQASKMTMNVIDSTLLCITKRLLHYFYFQKLPLIVTCFLLTLLISSIHGESRTIFQLMNSTTTVSMETFSSETPSLEEKSTPPFFGSTSSAQPAHYRPSPHKTLKVVTLVPWPRDTPTHSFASPLLFGNELLSVDVSPAHRWRHNIRNITRASRQYNARMAGPFLSSRFSVKESNSVILIMSIGSRLRALCHGMQAPNVEVQLQTSWLMHRFSAPMLLKITLGPHIVRASSDGIVLDMTSPWTSIGIGNACIWANLQRTYHAKEDISRWKVYNGTSVHGDLDYKWADVKLNLTFVLSAGHHSAFAPAIRLIPRYQKVYYPTNDILSPSVQPRTPSSIREYSRIITEPIVAIEDDMVIERHQKVFLQTSLFVQKIDIYGLLCIQSESPITLAAHIINVHPGGELYAGAHAQCSVRNEHISNRSFFADVVIHILGLGSSAGFLHVHAGAQLSFIGSGQTSWTKLKSPVKRGSIELHVRQCLNWQPGHTLYLSTTDFHHEQTSRRVIVDVQPWNQYDMTETRGSGNFSCLVQVNEPFQFNHACGNYHEFPAIKNMEECATVADVSRSFVVTATLDANARVFVDEGATAFFKFVEFQGLGVHTILNDTLPSNPTGENTFDAKETDEQQPNNDSIKFSDEDDNADDYDERLSTKVTNPNSLHALQMDISTALHASRVDFRKLIQFPLQLRKTTTSEMSVRRRSHSSHRRTLASQLGRKSVSPQASTSQIGGAGNFTKNFKQSMDIIQNTMDRPSRQNQSTLRQKRVPAVNFTIKGHTTPIYNQTSQQIVVYGCSFHSSFLGCMHTSMLSQAFLLHDSVGIAVSSSCFISSDYDTRGSINNTLAIMISKPPETCPRFDTVVPYAAEAQDKLNFTFGIVSMNPNTQVINNVVVAFVVGVAIRGSRYERDSAMIAQLSEFRRNEAVATGLVGIAVQGHYPLWDGEWKAVEEGRISDLHTWKCSGVSVYIEGRNFSITGTRITDVGSVGIILSQNNPLIPERLVRLSLPKARRPLLNSRTPTIRLLDSIIVGQTQNVGTPEAWSTHELQSAQSLPHIRPTQLLAVGIYGTAPMRIDGALISSFLGRSDLQNASRAAAFGWIQRLSFGSAILSNPGASAATTVSNITLHRILQGVRFGDDLNIPVNAEALLLDLDGSLVGTPNTFLFKNTPLLLPESTHTSKCQRPPLQVTQGHACLCHLDV